MPKEKVKIPSTILRSDQHAQRTWKKTHDTAGGKVARTFKGARAKAKEARREYQQSRRRRVRRTRKS